MLEQELTGQAIQQPVPTATDDGIPAGRRRLWPAATDDAAIHVLQCQLDGCSEVRADPAAIPHADDAATAAAGGNDEAADDGRAATTTRGMDATADVFAAATAATTTAANAIHPLPPADRIPLQQPLWSPATSATPATAITSTVLFLLACTGCLSAACHSTSTANSRACKTSFPATGQERRRTARGIGQSACAREGGWSGHFRKCRISTYVGKPSSGMCQLTIRYSGRIRLPSDQRDGRTEDWFRSEQPVRSGSAATAAKAKRPAILLYIDSIALKTRDAVVRSQWRRDYPCKCIFLSIVHNYTQQLEHTAGALDSCTHATSDHEYE